MVLAFFRVGDDQRGAVAGEADEIAVGNLKGPSRRGLHAERLVGGDQIFDQRSLNGFIISREGTRDKGRPRSRCLAISFLVMGGRLKRRRIPP